MGAVAALVVGIAVVVGVGIVRSEPGSEVGHVVPCRQDRRNLAAAIHAFAKMEHRHPTGIGELLASTAFVDGKQVSLLSHRPRCWTIASDGHGSIVPRSGVDMPSECSQG